MASLYYQQQAAAVYYAVLGKNASHDAYDYFAKMLESKKISTGDLVSSLIKSRDGQARFSNMSESEILEKIYINIYKKKPTADEINELLKMGNIANAVDKLIDDTLYYTGFDPIALDIQSGFESQINEALYPAAANIASEGAQTMLGIYYATGGTVSQEGVNYWGEKLVSGEVKASDVAQKYIESRKDLTKLSNEEFVEKIYENLLHRAPTKTELLSLTNELNKGLTKGDLVLKLIDTVENEATEIDLDAQKQFAQATMSYKPGQLPELSHQEKVASIYLAILGRDVDASALDTWSKELASNTTNVKNLINFLMESKEFQSKVGNLSIEDFVKKVYTNAWGEEPTQQLLINYSAIGNKSDIAEAIISNILDSDDDNIDLATSVAKNKFEHEVGTSLLYKTSATLSNLSSGESPVSSINTGINHELNNTEISVLEDAMLNIDSNNTVNLTHAGHLKNLTISGNKSATVNLSENGINPGVNIKVNNGNIVLNASSGDDKVTIGKEANIAHGTATLNLGTGNDTLSWDGNATQETNNSHQVSEFITADGGSGVNTISANLITKKMHILDRVGYNYTDFTSNAANFKNFQYVELGGYTGKSESTSTSGGKLYTLATKSNVFDYGLLNGTAKGEGYLDESGVNRAPYGDYGYKKNTTQAEIPDNVGTLGMKLSSKADHVVVNNYFPSQATIAGNATASSDITLNLSDSFVGDTFNIHFDYSENADSKNAGVLELNVIDKVKLKNIDIDSNGNGNTEDTLFLAGTNHATSINISGNNHVNLKVNSEYKELRSIDASNNNASVTISSDVSGQGNGKWSTVVKQIPKDKWTGEFVSQDVLTVKGSSFDDTLTLKDAMTAYGNAGNDTFIIGASSTMLETGKTVTIADFDVKEDKIVDMDSGISFSSEYSTGNAIYDYGVRSPEEIAAIKKIASSGSFTPDKTGFDLVSKMLSLSKNDKLEGKVGLATVGETHYLVIDQNNDHRLDKSDKIIVIKGSSHDEIINDLKYSTPELNGIASSEMNYSEMIA